MELINPVGKIVILLVTVCVFAVHNANAAIIGTDDASQYGSGWLNGTDGSATGDAFGAWELTTNGVDGGSTAGHFIGSSTALTDWTPESNFAALNAAQSTGMFYAEGGSTPSIDISGKAFAMYGTGGAAAIASRPLIGGGLFLGQRFSVDMAVNDAEGYKVIEVLNGSGSLFEFKVSGATGGTNTTYKVDNAWTGNGTVSTVHDVNTIFHLSFTQTAWTGGDWEITRSGGVNESYSGTYNGTVDRVNFYVGVTGVDNSSKSLYFNNLSVTAVPEPSSIAMLTLVAGGFLYGRRRRLIR